MERLTDPAQGYCEMYCKKYGRCFADPGDCIFEKEKDMYEKLKEIEGIVPFERLLELAFSDRAGRCVVLPCRENDTLTDCGIECRADHWNIYLTAFTLDGHKVRLLNVEEAEAALKGAQDG